jgi:hypothetical protein
MTLKKKTKAAKPITAEAIARLADRGEDISAHFNGQARMVRPGEQEKKPPSQQ